jgi:hypothetical protein
MMRDRPTPPRSSAIRSGRAFYSLGAAVNRKLVEVVGNVPVPDHLKPFPIFRRGNFDPKTKAVARWWLGGLENEKSWRVGTFALEQWKLLILSVWTRSYCGRMAAGERLVARGNKQPRSAPTANH